MTAPPGPVIPNFSHSGAVSDLDQSDRVGIAAAVDRVEPFRKLRSTVQRRDPGGGGINVARVLKRFGADVTVIYVAGGAAGQYLQRLVACEDLRSVVIAIEEETRQDLSFFERQGGQHYRFVFSGPMMGAKTQADCLLAIEKLDPAPAFLVASGSLPPGLAPEFYALAARSAKTREIKFILDTSGPALAMALAERPHLIKPNLRELRELSGLGLDSEAQIIAAAKALVTQGRAELVAR